MKIREAIEFADEIKPNSFGASVKIRLLSELEKMIQLEVLLFAPEELISYAPGDDEKELLITTHDNLYTDYLVAKIDYLNGEYNKYANTLQTFNASYTEFKRWFSQNYRPADTHGEYYENEEAEKYGV